MAKQANIVIVGSGFGGVAVAIALKNAGINDFLILERANDVGGVWRDNTYPGASCDIASRLYSYSFAQDWKWTGAYAPQTEILAYIKHCIAKYGVTPHILLNTNVVSAEFDETRALWLLAAKNGEQFESRVLVSAVGVFNQPKTPQLEGQSNFTGDQFHSSQWNYACSLENRRVAVIGNGASAVQFVPHVARVAERVFLFQRTPQWVMPRGLFPGSSALDAALRNSRLFRRLGRLKLFLTYEQRILRRALRPQSQRRAEAGFRRSLERRVDNQQLRAQLVPKHPFGCRRPLGSDEWFDTLQRANVELVTEPVSRVFENGLRTQDDRSYEVDVIIYGTGFTSTAYLSSLSVIGRHGQTLSDAWKEGAEAYLGMAVPNFPNLFLVYGPNTNAPNVLFMLECQARYISECVRLISQNRVTTMSVRAQVLRRYTDDLTRRLSRTDIAATNCVSSNLKQESGRITVAWPGCAAEYMWLTRRVRPQDYELTP
jgi:cation diffusion facilitator CzcD-associated flavoprotein CzcO